MQLEFKKETFDWMPAIAGQVQTQEQTLELKLSDGMPDIGRVLGSWGQPVLRSKEWRGDSFSASGGMMVWVLYSPEDGTQPRFLSGWIPWQLSWDLPEGVPDGQISVCCRTRFVDARWVSARKVMVRAGISVLGEAFAPDTYSVWTPREIPEDVQLLTNEYPLRMSLEAGEKAFYMEEELTLPGSCPVPARLVSYSVRCRVPESRVLSGRVLFRGIAEVHVLYMNEEGQLFSWDFPVSISQYEDLRGSFSQDAQVEFRIEITDLDIQLDDDGHFRMKAGVIAQYVVDDVRMIPVTEDAYSPVRDTESLQTEVTMTPVLDRCIREMAVQQVIPQDANVIADVRFLPDFPRQRRNGDRMELTQTASVQILYCNPEGILQSSGTRWEGSVDLPLHPDALVQAVPAEGMAPEAQITGEGIVLKGTLSVQICSTARQTFSVVTQVDLGEDKERSPDRPSLVLCRAGDRSLWQLARENGSTVAAIRDATGLEGEPYPGQMLLIPVM